MAKIANIKRNDANQLEFDFADGEVITYDIHALPDHIKEQLMFLGATNKLRDSYSSAEGSCSVARGHLEKAFHNLEQGLWNASRASGSSSGISELAEAIATLKKYEVDAVMTTLEAMSKEEIANMRKHPQVKAKIAEIKAKRAKERMKEAQEEFDFTL